MKRRTVDKLLQKNANLNEAVSILIQGIKDKESATRVLAEWDEFRNMDAARGKRPPTPPAQPQKLLVTYWP